MTNETGLPASMAFNTVTQSMPQLGSYNTLETGSRKPKQTVTLGPVNPCAANVMSVPGIERKEVVLMALVAAAEKRRGTRELTGMETEAASEATFINADIKKFKLMIWEPLRNNDGRTET